MKAVLVMTTVALAVFCSSLALAAEPVRVPGRGLTQEAVSRNFGEPQERMAPVGDPPITRWRYAGMTVYFEYDRVLHTVVHATDE
jgi:hypothetical protein